MCDNVPRAKRETSLWHAQLRSHSRNFAAYLAKKRAEGKHYNVAISHAAKKLVRLIYAMEKTQQPYRPAA